jgi:hypothetical protein
MFTCFYGIGLAPVFKQDFLKYGVIKNFEVLLPVLNWVKRQLMTSPIQLLVFL